MLNIGSSSVNLKNIRLVSLPSQAYIGFTGPTGPTGATGFTGPTGPTGATGYDLVTIINNSAAKNLVVQSNGWGLITAFGSLEGNTGNYSSINKIDYTIENTGTAPDPSKYFLPFKEKIGITSYFKTLSATGDVSVIIGSAGITLSGSTAGTVNYPLYALLYFPTSTGVAVPLVYNNNIIAGYTSQSWSGITQSMFSAKISTFKEYKSLTGLTNINVAIETSHGSDYFKDDETIHKALQLIASSANTSIDRLKIYESSTGLTLVDKKYIKFYNNSSTLEGISFTQEIIQGATFTVADRLYGSCCYCNEFGGGDTADTNICLDYVTKKYCTKIKGRFSSSKSCNERRGDPTSNCFYGGSCCVNGTCIENISEPECKKFNGFFARGLNCLGITCPNLCNIDSTTGERRYSCCIKGNCYNIPEDRCFTLGGIFQPKPCSEVNCCDYGFFGACCKGVTCYENYNPVECSRLGGIYQGPGSLCQHASCCSDAEAAMTLLNSYQPTTNIVSINGEQLPCDLKIGDYFGGGYFAGFIGYPTPTCWGSTPSIARGEIIGDLEWNGVRSLVNYVPVSGGYTDANRCQCANLPASRYSLENDLQARSGKAISININYLSWNSNNNHESSIPYITYLNRIQDLCLPIQYTNTDYCVGSPTGDRKYGYNPVAAYKTVADKIYKDQKLPRVWAIIVSPEDVYYDNISWGMSNATSSFADNTNNEYGLYLWENTELTPYGTSVNNGYLNTKMFDYTSGENLIWFTPIKNGVDPLAYSKFKHSLQNYWHQTVVPEMLNSDPVYYTQKYNEMWEITNPKNSAVKLISDMNKNNYNGYSDWYIPSITELNIVFNNFTKINENIFKEEYGEPISANDMYWSSTSGAINTPYVRGNFDYSNCINPNLELPFTDQDTNKKIWKDYKTSMGHNMYIQNFNTGKATVGNRDKKLAKLRPVRMIPIYSYDSNSTEQLLYSGKNLFECTNCSQVND